MNNEKEQIDWLKYETQARGDGRRIVCGVDEAGRGPLAGPVFAAAVVLREGQIIEGANDSKKLSERKREQLFDVIIAEAEDYCIASVDEKTIDEINILQATKKAMRAAAGQVPADVFLIDAVTNLGLDGKEIPIIKGDATSYSIAAASIIAKVTRDRQMAEADSLWPEYGFARNKGYGTREHIEALKKYGPCPIHRKSFIGNFV